MKRIVAIALCALMPLCLLCACGGGGKKDVPVSELAAAVTGAIGKTAALAESDSIFQGITGKSAAEIGEHVILVQANGTSIDEIGIFKAGVLSTKELKGLIEDYLKLYEEKQWPMIELYNPTEKPKLTGAEGKITGDYVMYCILSDADRGAASQAFENALK